MKRPIPVPDELTKPFWDAVDLRRLIAQQCNDCQRFQHPPQRACLSCKSSNLAFVPVSGEGTIYTYTIVHDTRVEGLSQYLPFPLVAVQLREPPELLMLTNLPGAAPEDIRIGMPVTVDFEEVAPGRFIPQFRISAGKSAG